MLEVITEFILDIEFTNAYLNIMSIILLSFFFKEKQIAQSRKINHSILLIILHNMKWSRHLYAFCKIKLRKQHRPPMQIEYIFFCSILVYVLLKIAGISIFQTSDLFITASLHFLRKEKKILIIWSDWLNFSRAIHAIAFQKKRAATKDYKFGSFCS